MPVSITGHATDPSGAVLGLTAFVRFELRGTNGNTPRVVGTTTIVPALYDFHPVAGLISGVIYANNEIEAPNGQFPTYWHVTWYPDGATALNSGANFTINAPFNLDSAVPNSTNPVVLPPTGDGTYGRLDGGNGPFAVLTAKNMGGIRFADQFTGANIGAKINAAIADAGGSNCLVYVPAGTYSFSTTIQFQNGVVICGAGMEATILAYTGSGTAVSMSSVTGAGFRNCKVTTNNAAAIGLVVAGGLNTVEDVHLNGTSAKMLNVTGYGGSSQSATTWLSRVRIDGFAGIGLQIDHAIDTFLSDVSIFPTNDSAVAQPCVIDTGASGVYADGTVSIGWGLHGLTVKHSSPGAGGYGAAPTALRFLTLFVDTTTGGDCILFDSTLGTNNVNAKFLGGWAAFAGHNTAGTTVTAGANGFRLSGGQGIFIGAGFSIHLNAGNGVLVDNANVKQVQAVGAEIVANNTDNNADQHGWYVTAAAKNIALIGCTSGNILYGGGANTPHQKFAVKIAAVSCDELRLIGNDFNTNDTGAISNGNTANSVILGNLPSASAASNVLWGVLVMTNTLSMNGNAAIGVNYVESNTANRAASGILRLASADGVGWRNNANSADITLAKDSSDNLTYNGSGILQQTGNGGKWTFGQSSELLTLSTSGTTTDTSANLLPANSIIESVVARVTTTITTATDWKLGDATQAARFTAAQSGGQLTAGATVVGVNQADPTVATANLGPVQVAAAKVRVTTTGTPGAGALRITVFYRQFVAPTS